MRACMKQLQSVVLIVLMTALIPSFALVSDAFANSAPQEITTSSQTTQSTSAQEHQIAPDAHGSDLSSSLSSKKLKDLFWRTVNFLALVVILVKFGAKPILSGLSGRQQRIREELEALTVRRDEAEKAYQQFEAKLAGMEKEMELIVERAITQAQVEKERILADAEKVAEDIKRQAEAAVQSELEDAKRILREEIAEQAATMAEELIRKNLTQADQITITEQYLARVGAVQ